MNSLRPIGEYVLEVMAAFRDPDCRRVELKPDHNLQKFHLRFYKAMRTIHQNWLLTNESDKNILHVTRKKE